MPQTVHVSSQEGPPTAQERTCIYISQRLGKICNACARTHSNRHSHARYDSTRNSYSSRVRVQRCWYALSGCRQSTGFSHARIPRDVFAYGYLGWTTHVHAGLVFVHAQRLKHSSDATASATGGDDAPQRCLVVGFPGPRSIYAPGASIALR